SVDPCFTWTVTGTNQAPTTSGIADQSDAEGDVVSLDVNAAFADADGDSLTLGSASLLPDGVSFAAGVFSGTLSFISAGSYPITVSASDGNGGSVDASFTWLVTDVFTVTASSGGNGTITPASQTVAFDGTASFTVTPSTGYHVVSVSGDTCTVTGSGTSYSAANIQADCAVSATFAIDEFTVTASSGGNGTITPPSQTVAFDGTASFTVTPSTGYQVVSVSGDTCTPTGTCAV